MKVAYIGDWHPTKGTYYRQRITVTQEEYNMINQRMIEHYRRTQKDIKEAGIITSEQLNTMTYGKPLDFAYRVDQTIYLTLTQLYMIAAAIFGMPEYEKAYKRITNNNTILMIKG